MTQLSREGRLSVGQSWEAEYAKRGYCPLTINELYPLDKSKVSQTRALGEIPKLPGKNLLEKIGTSSEFSISIFPD